MCGLRGDKHKQKKNKRETEDIGVASSLGASISISTCILLVKERWCIMAVQCFID